MANLSNLTSRELEILELVSSGHSNKLIADEIQISEKTVEFHLNNIYTKIGVRSRLLAALWAIRNGINAQASAFEE